MKNLIAILLIVVALSTLSQAQPNAETNRFLITRLTLHNPDIASSDITGDFVSDTHQAQKKLSALRDKNPSSGDYEIATVTPEQKMEKAVASIEKELKLIEEADKESNQAFLNLKAIPIVMNSSENKIISVVIPPFMYFKKEF